MDPEEIQRLLKKEAPFPMARLPKNFADETLAKGKVLRRLIQQHWKRLAAASVVSVLIAIALGMASIKSPPEDRRPPLSLFQTVEEAAPFSTK